MMFGNVKVSAKIFAMHKYEEWAEWRFLGSLRPFQWNFFTLFSKPRVKKLKRVLIMAPVVNYYDCFDLKLQKKVLR